MKIFKFSLFVTDEQKLKLPAGSEVLTVQTQNGIPCLWALIPDEKAPLVERSFQIIGTGNLMPPLKDGEQGRYVNTFQLNGGSFVGHVFEMITE